MLYTTQISTKHLQSNVDRLPVGVAMYIWVCVLRAGFQFNNIDQEL